MADTVSLPSRERGSKLPYLQCLRCAAIVAPFTGAWIETLALGAELHAVVSLPSRERGSKPDPERKRRKLWTVAPFTGAWIETITAAWHSVSSAGRSLHGSVDRNITTTVGLTYDNVAPFTGAWIETYM